MSIAPLDAGQYPDLGTVNQIRNLLMRRDGQPVASILDEIDARYHVDAQEPARKADGAPLPVSERRVPRRSRE